MGLLMFIVALIIAGIFMAYGESGRRSAVQIASRIFGPARDRRSPTLCTATIRAVAQGVVGIAFIQMLLVGVAFVLMGVPGAGLLALAVLLFGIMQLPATLITVPVIIFVFVTEGASVATIVFAIYRLHRRPGRQRAEAIAAGTWRRRADARGTDRRAGRHGHQRHHRPVHRSGDSRGRLPAVLAMG